MNNVGIWFCYLDQKSTNVNKDHNHWICMDTTVTMMLTVLILRAPSIAPVIQDILEMESRVLVSEIATVLVYTTLAEFFDDWDKNVIYPSQIINLFRFYRCAKFSNTVISKSQLCYGADQNEKHFSTRKAHRQALTSAKHIVIPIPDFDFGLSLNLMLNSFQLQLYYWTMFFTKTI